MTFIYPVSRLFLRGRNNHYHPLPFQPRHLLWLSVFKQRLREFQQLLFSLLLVQDAAAFEEHIDSHLVSLLEEPLGVVQFELEVVVVNLRAQSYFLHHHLGRVCLALLLLLLQFVKEFLILDNLAHRRVCCGRNHHKVQTLVVCKFYRILGVVNGGFHTLPYYSYNGSGDALVHLMVRFFFCWSATTVFVLVARFEWCCYNLVLLY